MLQQSTRPGICHGWVSSENLKFWWWQTQMESKHHGDRLETLFCDSVDFVQFMYVINGSTNENESTNCKRYDWRSSFIIVAPRGFIFDLRRTGSDNVFVSSIRCHTRCHTLNTSQSESTIWLIVQMESKNCAKYQLWLAITSISLIKKMPTTIIRLSFYHNAIPRYDTGTAYCDKNTPNGHSHRLRQI